MSGQKTIETPRLLLKAITPGQKKEIFATKSKEEIKTIFNYTDTDYDRWVNNLDMGIETYAISFMQFMVSDKHSGKIVGECGFHTWNKKHRRAEAYYMLFDDSDKGQGIMSEAFPAILKYAFEELNIHRVAALIAKDNTPSLKLLLKCGFKFEGTMREDYNVDGKNEDSECYSLLKQEWKK
ncbi:MAG: GNAT family N-acetyltransferase [Bacteroidia bacterium]